MNYKYYLYFFNKLTITACQTYNENNMKLQRTGRKMKINTEIIRNNNNSKDFHINNT